MKQAFLSLLLTMTFASLAFAEDVVAVVPEVDGATATTAAGLLAGALSLIRARRNRGK